jgi:hypothetical protein
LTVVVGQQDVTGHVRHPGAVVDVHEPSVHTHRSLSTRCEPRSSHRAWLVSVSEGR